MWCLKYTILFCIDIKLWTEVSYAKSPFPCSSLWFAWTPYNWHGKEEMLLSQVPVRCDIQFSRTAALLGAKNVFCMHPYFNYFSPFFFSFLIPTFLHCSPPAFQQLFMYQRIYICSVAFWTNGVFFPSFVTEVTTCFCWLCFLVFFFSFGIFADGKQALKCSPPLVHEEIAIAFQSQHGVAFH